jgi:hypothetical protein
MPGSGTAGDMSAGCTSGARRGHGISRDVLRRPVVIDFGAAVGSAKIAPGSYAAVVAAVPAPASPLPLGSGSAGMGAFARRRKTA